MGDNLPAINLGSGRSAKAIATGQHFACALLDNAAVKCWGSNDVGELGLGDTQNRGDRPNEMGDNLPTVDLGSGRSARAVSIGVSTCVLLDNGAVKCWGYNALGTLGLGDTLLRGAKPGEMGDALPEIQLGTGRTAQAISAGYQHTCALLDDGTVKCWGGGGGGMLGLGDTANRGDGPGEMGDALPPLDLTF